MAGIDSRVMGVVHSLSPQAEEMFSGVGFGFVRRFLRMGILGLWRTDFDSGGTRTYTTALLEDL